MPKVLVADDSIAVRKVAERLLTEAGLGVTLAANGEEALAYLAKERPDLIVSDVIMPDKSGYEVCAFVRTQSALAETPVLLISGIVNDEVTKQAESCRADGVLKKPFQGTSLKDRVLELLAKRQSQSTTVLQPPSATPGSAETAKDTVASGEQLQGYHQATVKLAHAEEALRRERQHSEELTKRIAQLEKQCNRLEELELKLSGQQQGQSEQADRQKAELVMATQRVQELEHALKEEREQAEHAKSKVLDLEERAGHVQELESLLASEREQQVQLKKEMAELRSQAARVEELDLALQEERALVGKHAQRIAEIQKTVTRVQELESALNAERQAAAELVQQMTSMEKAVSRSQELSQQVAQEQQRAQELSKRLSESESKLSSVGEMHQLLESERERNAILLRRVSEAELAAEQATKRFEEIAKKLGEIANLASQLGGGAKFL